MCTLRSNSPLRHERAIEEGARDCHCCGEEVFCEEVDKPQDCARWESTLRRTGQGSGRLLAVEMLAAGTRIIVQPT